MKSDPKRLDVVLSMYQKTTEIFSEFRRATNIVAHPLHIDYVYDTLYLKNFMTISFKVNGKTSNYDIGFLVKHCDSWDKESQLKRQEIEYGIKMSNLKKEYYKQLIYSASEDGILCDIFDAVRSYVEQGNVINESIISIPGFELYAQDTFSRNNPGCGIEYGETDTYLVNVIVVDKVGLVWSD